MKKRGVVEAGYLKRRAGAQEIYVPALTVQIANTSEKIIKQLMLLAYFEREKKSVGHAALSIIKLKPGERREVMLKCLESIGFGTVFKGLSLIQTTMALHYEVRVRSEGITIVFEKDTLKFKILI